jgi:hypothetical protein
LCSLAKDAKRFSVRSSFLACAGTMNGGHDDASFGSLKDISQSCRSLIYVDTASIPTVNSMPQAINNYIVDYYRHGQFQAILKQNRLSDRVAYDNINDFSLVLKTIVTALETHDSDWFFTRYMHGLSDRFRRKFNVAVKEKKDKDNRRT